MQFLIAIYHPEGYDGSTETSEMRRAIDQLNEEMVAAGVRVFVGGLRAAGEAHSLIAAADGQLEHREGAYLPTREHIGGFWVLEASHLEAALDWGRKAALACRAPVEVRPFH